jgi:ribosomal protein L35
VVGAKKRFRTTGTGKVKAKHSGKLHGMIKTHAQIPAQGAAGANPEAQ